MRIIYLPFLLSLCTVLEGQFTISSLNVDQSIDFNSYDANTLSPSTQGITSNEWAMAGLKNGDINFGGTAGKGGKDFKGVSDGTAGKGGVGEGIYAFDISNGGTEDRALGFSPKKNFFGPGTFTLRFENNTGQTINSLNVEYDIFDYNREDQQSFFIFSHSDDPTSNYTNLASLDFASIAGKNNTPTWAKTQKSTTINNLSIADGGVYYLRWAGDSDANGKELGDLIGLDNVTLNASAIPEPSTVALIFGAVAFFAVAIKKRYIKEK